jgi:hypothetical protein
MARRRLGADARALTKKGKPCDGAVRGKKNSRRRAGGGEGISDFGNVLLTKNLGSEGEHLMVVVGGKGLIHNHGNIYLDGR